MTDPLERDIPNRDADLMAELHDLTCNLRNALDRFRFDARLNDLAEKEMPDARQRLNHVLHLTSDAAHRTLDLVERSGPAAERTAREAGELDGLWQQFRSRQISPENFRSMLERMDEFLRNARADSDIVRANLAEVLLAQGYQDLSGQIIRGVMTLVAEVEKTLAELTRLARGEVASVLTVDTGRDTRQTGPAVPGVDSGAAVVSDQEDVDALLSRLGM
jgi:chemotaxis protein CheZ